VSSHVKCGSKSSFLFERRRRTSWVPRVLCPLLLISAQAAMAQTKAPESHPAPQVTGRLIGTDGARGLILEYETDAGRKTFIGKIQSTCMIPARSRSSQTRPLELSSIPQGSELTLFYVPHEIRRAGWHKWQNFVLALRVDRLNGNSPIPVGKMIPCYKASPPPAK
jgi:hypothetical protein